MAYYKKISIIILSILLIFLFCNCSYCTDVTFEYNNQQVTITGINNPYPAFAIFIDTDTGYNYDNYYIYSWDSTSSKFLYSESSSGYSTFGCVDSSNNRTPYYWSFAKSTSLDISNRNFQERNDYYTPGTPRHFVYTNTEIYDYNNRNNIIFEPTLNYTNPIIYNKNEISSANFDSVVIKINDYEITDNLYLTTIYNPINTGTTGSGEIAYYYSAHPVELNYSSKYYVDNYNNDSLYIVPKSELNLLPNTQYFLVLSTQSEMFYNTLGVYNYLNDPNALDCVTFNTGQTITSQDVTNNELNNQTESINNQTESINNINNTLNDDTVSSTASDLPSINVNNPTENGLNNIFNSIYVAFCEGEPQILFSPYLLLIKI